VYTFGGTATIDSHSVLTVDDGPVVFPHTSVGASATQTIHVNLTNSQTSVGEAFNVLPILDPDFTIQNQCPSVLVPTVPSGTGFTTSCEIVVTFAPQAPGFHLGALTYRSSLQGGSLVLAGTAVAPVVAVVPTSVTFPATAVGSSAVAQVLTVTNPGGSAITITGVVLGGAQADDFVSVSNCGASLAAGASCTVGVTFKPVSAGNKQASITLSDSGGGPLKVALSGTGQASGTPSLSPSVYTMTFPIQAAGTSSAAQTIMLTNRGTANLALTSISLTGPQADDFLLTNPCGPSLAVGASCTLAVTFKPVSAGTKHAAITVVDNAAFSPLSVPLTGLGVPASAVPGVELSSTALLFPKQATGTSSVGQTVTLINSGASTLTLRSITLAGGQADDYVLSPTCGASLAAGAGCTLTVVFKPVSAGTKHASIIIADDASGSPQSIAVTGTGT
jgi:hypothetical protein